MISRSVARSGRPAMPTVGNVVSRSASLQAEVRRARARAAPGRRAERIDVGEEVAADAVGVEELVDAPLHHAGRQDALRRRRGRRAGHPRLWHGRRDGRREKRGSVRLGNGGGPLGQRHGRAAIGVPGRGLLEPLEERAPARVYRLRALLIEGVKLLIVASSRRSAGLAATEAAPPAAATATPPQPTGPRTPFPQHRAPAVSAPQLVETIDPVGNTMQRAKKSTMPLVGAIGLLMVVSAAGLAAVLVMHKAQHPAAAPSSGASLAAPAFVPPPEQSQAANPPAEPARPEEPSPSSASPAPSAGTAASSGTRRVASPPSPPRAPAAAPAAPLRAANCDPPFFLDAQGNHVFKKECVK